MPDTDWIALGMGIVTASGVIYTISQGIRSDKEDRELRFAEFLTDNIRDLNHARDRRSKLNSIEDCENYIAEVNNILDRIAYLYDRRQIKDHMINYFDWFFEYGLRLVDWKVWYWKNKELFNLWPYLMKYAKRRNLKPVGDIPSKLRDLLVEQYPELHELQTASGAIDKVKPIIESKLGINSSTKR